MKNQKEVVQKNKGKGFVLIIVFLVIIILGLICYICYDKGIFFENKEKSVPSTSSADKKNTNDESIIFSDSELEKYVNYISPQSIGPSALIYDVNSISAINLSAADKIKYIASNIYSKHTSTADYQYDIVSENDVKNVVEEVYGSNSYERTTFNMGCDDYTFNEIDGNYYSHTGCGGTTATSAKNVIIDYKATKNKLEIITAYVFYDGTTKKIYKDFNMTNSLADYTGDNSTSEIELYLNDYIKNNKEKLNTIVYTFESTNGTNYYFKGFTNNR